MLGSKNYFLGRRAHHVTTNGFTEFTSFLFLSSMLAGLVLRISAFIYPHSKTSKGFKSVNRVAQGKSDFHDFNPLGKGVFSQSMDSFAVTGIGPTC